MKRRYKVLIPIASIVLLIGGFCGGVIINGNAPKGKLVTGNEEWMKYLSNDTFLNEVALPGSHDAGTNKMVWLGETQNLSIKDQLYSGSRYFDIRVNKKAEDKFVIYHSVVDGLDFEPMLKDIKDFIVAYPSETLLLDFQHFKNDSQNDVISFIDTYLYNEGLLIENNTTESDLKFISTLKVGDTRGKCIIFWGDRGQASSYKYLFARNNDTCSYEGMTLDSYYIGANHKNMKSKDFIHYNLPTYYEAIEDKVKNEIFKGIFVLQTQLTDGKLIFGPYSKEKRHSKNVTKYLTSDFYNMDEKYLRLINVVMRDFINKNKCDDVIKLNYTKLNIDNNFEAEFKEVYNI